MNENRFKAYVEAERDCDAALLDIAVNKGLQRARSRKPDVASLFKLAAMCAVTAVFCFFVSLEPVRIGAADYLLGNSLVPQNGSEVLHVSLSNITMSIIELLGGNLS